MITFELSEEEKMIKEMAREFGAFLREHSRKSEKEGVFQEIKEKYQELGLALADISEELGGYGYQVFRKVLALQGMAWGCAGTTLYLELPTINLHLIQSIETGLEEKLRFKDEVLKSPWGIYIDFDGVFSMSEDGKFSGKAWAVLGKDVRKFALIKGKELFLFVDGFSSQVKKPLALDAVGVSEVCLEKATPYIRFQIDYKRFVSLLRVYLSAILSGVLRASFEYASDYAMEREAFGKKIAHHQGLAFILSDFSISVSAADVYTLKAAWAIDTAQEDFMRVCADCFSFVSELAEEFTVWGVQILGGHGFVKDHPVEKWMREAKAISLLFGGKYYADVDSSELQFHKMKV